MTTDGYTVVSQQFAINCRHSENDEKILTNVMLDTGSQLTFIHENLRNSLNLPTLYTKTLNIKTFMNTENVTKNYDVVKVTLHNEEVYLDVVAIVVPHTASLSSPTTVNVLNECGFKLCLPPNINYGNEVGVLVGMDYYWRILTGPSKRSENLGLVYNKTLFGWIYSGSSSCRKNSDRNSSPLINSTNILFISSQELDKNLNNMIDQIFHRDFEMLGGSTSDNDLANFLQYISHDDEMNRYTTKLPWKNNRFPANHFEMCKNRLKLLHRKLLKDETLLDEL